MPSLQTWAILLAVFGAGFEIFGLTMVVKEIAADRSRARALLDKQRDWRPAEHRDPPKIHASMLEDRRSSIMRQQSVDPSRLLEHIAGVANAHLRFTKDVAEALDQNTGALLKEIDKGDRALRDVLRELLRGSIIERLLGVVAIGVGIVLSMSASILSTVG